MASYFAKMWSVNPVYKFLVVSSLWVTMSSFLEFSMIRTTTTTTTTTYVTIGGTLREIVDGPTVRKELEGKRKGRDKNNAESENSDADLDEESDEPDDDSRKKNALIGDIDNWGSNAAIEGEDAATEEPIFAQMGQVLEPFKQSAQLENRLNHTTHQFETDGSEIFRNCTSPETSIPWPFHEADHAPEQSKSGFPVAYSALNPNLKCGFGLHKEHANSTTADKTVRFMHYFENTVKGKIIQPILEEEKCTDLVVFGAAFGREYVRYMKNELESTDDDSYWTVDPIELVEQHGRCFFMFAYGSHDEPQKLGHYWLIPLRKAELPYKNGRRNAKLIKYMGQNAFLNHHNHGKEAAAPSKQLVSPDVIVWQDAKFFRGGFVSSVPRDYSSVAKPNGLDSPRHAPCLTTFGLPAHRNNFSFLGSSTSDGLTVSSYNRPRYQDHCQTIIDALEDRPGVTDSPEALMKQCLGYMEFVQRQKPEETKGNEEGDSLNFGLIDTAFIVWNESTQKCRNFNAVLRCTLLDQLHCHSDRDQVLFPLVIHQFLNPSSGFDAISESEDNSFSLKAVYNNLHTGKRSKIDNRWKPRAHDLDLVDRDAVLGRALMDGEYDKDQVFVRMVRSACHHYYFVDAPNQPYGDRTCGHHIWLRDSLKAETPSLEQELQLMVWSKSQDKDIDKAVRKYINSTQTVVALERGNHDRVEAPFATDFHTCTNQEFEKVPYTFREKIKGKKGVPKLSCGTKKGRLSSFHLELQKTVVTPLTEPLAEENDCDLVVFGQSFGEDINGLLSTLDDPPATEQAEQYSNRTKKMVNAHGKCFFLFVLEQHLPSKWKNQTLSRTIRGAPDDPTPALKAGHFWLIPVDKNVLPYESIKHNARLFQYNGQFFFPDAESVVYQDAVFFQSRFLTRQPIDYALLYPKDEGHTGPEPCLTTYSLPKNKATVGAPGSVSSDNFYESHCKFLINKMEKFLPDGSPTGESEDPIGTGSLIQQCDAYLQFVYKRELDTIVLNQAMADTNFIKWNEKTKFCRNFNAELRCTILDQMHCHTDRDRLIFPFALYVHQMGLGYSYTEYKRPKEKERMLVDNLFNKKHMDLNFYQMIPGKKSSDPPIKHDVVRIMRSGLHWTHRRLGVLKEHAAIKAVAKRKAKERRKAERDAKKREAEVAKKKEAELAKKQ